jgi:hypothetical protein
MAFNLIGYRGRAGNLSARPTGPRTEERQVKRNYDVQMEALVTFAGDSGEPLHPSGSLFFTTEARAAKYEKNLPRLARRVGKVSVSSGTVKRRKPAVKPEEKKAAKKKPRRRRGSGRR